MTTPKLVAVAVERGFALQASVSSRFGRCSRFLLIDRDTLEVVSWWDNPGRDAVEGAGIRTANEVKNRGAIAVLCGEFGPKATRALEELGVEAVRASPGCSVATAIAEYERRSTPS